jgi:hypothetical protein
MVLDGHILDWSLFGLPMALVDIGRDCHGFSWLCAGMDMCSDCHERGLPLDGWPWSREAMGCAG